MRILTNHKIHKKLIQPNPPSDPKSMLPEKTECSHEAPKNPWSCDRLWRNRPVLCRWASPVGAIHMHRDNVNQGATQQQKKTRCYSWRLTEVSKLWRSPCETRHWDWKDHEGPSFSSFPRKALARSGERTSENAPPQGSWAAWDATQNQSATCVPPIYSHSKWKHVINIDKPSKITIFMGCLKMFKVKVYQSLPHEYERCTKLGPPIGTNQAAECRQLEQRTKSHCAPVAEDCQCCETHLTTKTNQNMDIMCCKVWENQIVHVGHVGVSLYNIV